MIVLANYEAMTLDMASYAKIKLFGTDPRGTLWSFQLWAYLEATRVAGRAGSMWRHLLPSVCLSLPIGGN